MAIVNRFSYSTAITTGDVWQHFSGKRFDILHIAQDENQEKYIVFREASNPDAEVWVRSIESFCETLGDESGMYDRFTKVSDGNNSAEHKEKYLG